MKQMAAAPHEGRLLLGWMEHDDAIHWLTNFCAFDPPVTNTTAEQLWQEYRDRVEQIPPRTITSLKREKLNQTEQDIANKFLTALRAMGASHLKVVKVDALGLVVRQLYVNVDRANEHATSHWQSRAAFVRNCLPTHRLGPKVTVQLRPPGYCIPLPHAEFALAYVTNAPITTFILQQFMNYVTVVASSGVSSNASGGRPRRAEEPTSANYRTGVSAKCTALFSSS
jgi:hypothetical protein